jgi:hypothetical protein
MAWHKTCLINETYFKAKSHDRMTKLITNYELRITNDFFIKKLISFYSKKVSLLKAI